MYNYHFDYIDIFPIAGISNSFKSFKYKEQGSLKKYLGLIGSIAYIALYISIIVANFIDFTK